MVGAFLGRRNRKGKKEKNEGTKEKKKKKERRRTKKRKDREINQHDIETDTIQGRGECSPYFCRERRLSLCGRLGQNECTKSCE